MKAELSNVGLHRRRHFSGVYQQQGRMLVDRDWNELCEILRGLGTAVSSEAIGTGVPRHGGLVWNPSPPNPVLAMRNEGGLVAAAGVIGEVLQRDPEAAQPIYQNQLDLPATVRAPLTADRMSAPDLSVVGQTPEAATQLLLQGTPAGRLLYVDIWDRVVTVFETDEAISGDLIDPALHGADTCFRKQRLAQIKTATVTDLDDEADPCIPAFLPDYIPGKGNGIFTANVTPAGDVADPCDPCAEQVTMARSVTNHLFRLEVHSVGFDTKRRPNRLVLKWSRDNGARELRLADFATQVDQAHSYEYFSDATERLLGMPSDDWVAEDFLRGVLVDSVDLAPISAVLPRIREWDGWCELQLFGNAWRVIGGHYAGKALASASVSGGIVRVQLNDTGFSFSLTLAGKNFLAGDYWLALVRARAPVEPVDKRVRVISPTPIGVEHRYCVLGVISNLGGGGRPGPRDGAVVIQPEGSTARVATGGSVGIGDGAGAPASPLVFASLSAYDLRRLQHPSLTCLDAADVGYATDCPSGLFDSSHNTVKKALDQICHIRADQVAFAKPCDTSVYSQQPDADKIRTVADALKLLCSVSAEQIGFDPKCGYLQGAKTKNVMDALESLCVQPADTIPFTPECEYLNKQKVADVAAALNALCKRNDLRPFPMVQKVSWVNDAPLKIADLRKGLTVTFSEPMVADLLSTDSFIVTWEVPFGLRVPPEVMFTDFLTPQIMLGSVDVKSKDVTFVPTLRLTDAFLNSFLQNLGQMPPHDFAGLRCRVRLLGRSIFATAGNRPLDGHIPMVPLPPSLPVVSPPLVISAPAGAPATRAAVAAVAVGTPGPRRIDLDFTNPGLGQPSDFESWFYLVPTPVGPPPSPNGNIKA